MSVVGVCLSLVGVGGLSVPAPCDVRRAGQVGAGAVLLPPSELVAEGLFVGIGVGDTQACQGLGEPMPANKHQPETQRRITERVKRTKRCTAA